MNLYRQSIILFGIVIPLLCGLAVIAAGYMIQTNMQDSYQAKLKGFKTHRQAEIAAHEMENAVNKKRQHLERWTKQLSEEPASAFTTNLREISEKLPEKEIQQTAFEPSQSAVGFGQVCGQKSANIRVSFRGTFRTLQKAFLKLETRMPQLQLQNLRIDPIASSASMLNCQMSYTSWEN